MSREPLEPNVMNVVRDLNRRVYWLETKLGQLVDSRRTPLFFSISGSLLDFVGQETPPLRTVHSTEFDLVVPQLRVAPEADITIELTAYGPITGVVKSIVIPAGVFYVEDAEPFVIPAGGALTLQCSVGDDGTAMDLGCACIPKLL